MLNFLVMLRGKSFLMIEFTHKVTILLWVWRTRLQLTQNLMTALTVHCDVISIHMHVRFFVCVFVLKQQLLWHISVKTNSWNVCGKIPSGLVMIVTCIIVSAQKLINNVRTEFCWNKVFVIFVTSAALVVSCHV